MDTSRSFGVGVGPESGKFVAVDVRDHGGGTGSPARGADLTVLVSVLEALDKAEDLIDVTADGEVVDAELTEDTLSVDDVGGAKGDTLVIGVVQKAAVVAADGLGQVRDHRKVHGAKTTLLTRLLGVLSVSEVGIDGAADELGTNGLELGSLVAELADLGGADKGEVKGPEEEYDVLACSDTRCKEWS